MELVRDQVLIYVARHDCNLSGGLDRYVRDWMIVGSATVKLDGWIKSVLGLPQINVSKRIGLAAVCSHRWQRVFAFAAPRSNPPSAIHDVDT